MQLACDSLQGLGMLLLGLCLVPPPARKVESLYFDHWGA